MTISSFKANPSSQLLLVTDQVFRLKAEGYKTSRKARIKPFKTFSVSTTFGSIRDESWLGKKPKRFDKFS
jgi:hypothetical protein